MLAADADLEIGPGPAAAFETDTGIDVEVTAVEIDAVLDLLLSDPASGPNVFIGPYTSIGNQTTISNTEIENSIIMESAKIDCGKRITDSLIGRNVEILAYEQNIPKGHKLILGDMAKITL